MNTLYRDLILVQAEAAVGGALAAANINHPVLKGALCEIVIRDLLRPLLPADIGLGTGVIVTADNQQSRQKDILLIDRSIAPPVVFEEATGIFPIESVLFAIEIKKTLDRGDLTSSIKSAKELSLMPLLPGELDDNDNITTQRPPLQPVSAILAFNTDLKEDGMTELDRFNDCWNYSNGEPPIKLICVVGRGCWFWRQGKWESWSRTGRLPEVISFLTVIMNSYRKIGKSRGAPRLGNYILES